MPACDGNLAVTCALKVRSVQGWLCLHGRVTLQLVRSQQFLGLPGRTLAHLANERGSTAQPSPTTSRHRGMDQLLRTRTCQLGLKSIDVPSCDDCRSIV